MNQVFRVLQRLGASTVGSARTYFYVLAALLGLSTGFVLALGTAWSKQNAAFPGSDFIFIGGNMIFWTMFIALAMNIPLASLGSLLLREKTRQFVRAGFGRRHFVQLIAGQMWRPLLGALVIAAVLFVPFLSIISVLPHDDGSRLVDEGGVSRPSVLGILLGLCTLVVPMFVAVVVLSLGLVAGSQNKQKRSRSWLSALVTLSPVALGIVLVFAGFTSASQAGILFTFGLLLIGMVVASKLAPSFTVSMARRLQMSFGAKPAAVLAHSVSHEFRPRFSGISLFIYVIAGIPTFIFTASALQTLAEGKGGIAQWDFWTIFATPIALTLIAIVSAVLVLSQLMNRSLKRFTKLGTSVGQERSALLYTLALLVLGVMLVVLIALGVLTASMALVWDVVLHNAIQETYWMPLVVVPAFILVVAPLAYALIGDRSSTT